jgi:RimJ/RimL family protein N-acetyltransferase
VRALPALHRRRSRGDRDRAQALRRRGGALRELTGERVRLTPLAAADADALRGIRADPRIVEWWDELEPDFPLDDEPESTRLTIHHEGEIAGMVQFGEELEPKYRHASIDIFVAPSHQGRGVCSEAIRLVADYLLRERGHHRVTIDPAAENAAAVRCYTKAGFKPVGIMRLAERDADGRGWHDALMMELVVEPE